MENSFTIEHKDILNSSKVTKQNLLNHLSYEVTFWRQRWVNPDKTKTAGGRPRKVSENSSWGTRKRRLVLVWREETCRERDAQSLSNKINQIPSKDMDNQLNQHKSIVELYSMQHLPCLYPLVDAHNSCIHVPASILL